MAKERRFVVYLNDTGTVRQRTRFVTEKKDVIAFVVQLEVFHQDRWKAVLRYDGVHGFAHRDRYNLRGEQRKEALPLDFRDALTYAIADIGARWAEYVERFLRGEYP
jgi:hypothetical protein